MFPKLAMANLMVIDVTFDNPNVRYEWGGGYVFGAGGVDLIRDGLGGSPMISLHQVQRIRPNSNQTGQDKSGRHG